VIRLDLNEWFFSRSIVWSLARNLCFDVPSYQCLKINSVKKVKKTPGTLPEKLRKNEKTNGDS